MSSFDELLTTVSDDVRKAIESVCEKAGTFDADWCILRAAGEMISTHRLPRVSPENLVEGRWYVVRRGPEPVIARAVSTKWLFGIDEDGECVHLNKYNFEEDMFGPLPEFELEGEGD